MTTLEKLAITSQALIRPTFCNRYRFWRHVEDRSIASAAFMAVVCLLRQGD